MAIDAMEDEIAPLGANVRRIRELISRLELCHHKADRWVDNIIEAIAAGKTAKGLGTRPPGRQHPSETVWQNARDALAAWCAGCPREQIDLVIDQTPASRLLLGLGKPSPLKQWQVRRVIEKIHSFIQSQQPGGDAAVRYAWLLLSPGDYEFEYLERCPDYFTEHEDFWRRTARTMIRDTENNADAELSLALAIDMLWPCHWRFVENLRIVLDAIGGKLDAAKPFAACGRNINLLPIRRRMETVVNTLQMFYAGPGPVQEVDGELLLLLGQPTAEKKWLAAALDKTIRLQLNPPVDLRTVSALSGPDWLKQQSPG